MKYYMTPDVQVSIRIPGSKALLLDEVCGIGYQANSSKVPVYSYKDITFSAMAEGRSIISGLLLVNKTFKDSIGSVLANLVTSDSDDSETVRDLNKRIKDAEQITQGHSDQIREYVRDILDLTRFLPKSNSSITYPNPWDIGDITSLAGLLDDYMNNNKASSSFITSLFPDYGEYKRLLDLAIDELVISNSNKVSFSSTGLPLIPTINSSDKSTLGSIESLSREFVDVIVALTDESIQRQTNSEISSSALAFDSAAERTARLIDTKLFNLLQQKNKKIELIVEFGVPDETTTREHKIVIEECYFSGESVNVSVDDRSNIKEAYQFLARSIT